MAGNIILLTCKKRSLIEIKNNKQHMSLVINYEKKNFSSIKMNVSGSIKTSNKPTLIDGIIGIVKINSFDFLVVVSEKENIGFLEKQKNINRIKNVLLIPMDPSFSDSTNEIIHKTLKIIKKFQEYFQKGTFYYSKKIDLTVSVQHKKTEQTTFKNIKKKAFMHVGDKNNLWNKFLIKKIFLFREFLSSSEKKVFDSCEFVLFLIQGYVSIKKIFFENEIITTAIISRINCKRTGTRCSCRGIDEKGHVSGFVETEIIIETKEVLFSSISVRGSVPIFWEQKMGNLLKKINIIRSFESTQSSFDKHFLILIKKYKLVHVISLLSQKKNIEEAKMSKLFYDHLSFCKYKKEISSTFFDFHSSTQKKTQEESFEILLERIETDILNFGYFLKDKQKNHFYPQRGVFRINCFDSIDRTNLVQEFISRKTTMLFLKDLNTTKNNINNLISTIQKFWIESGDEIGKIHTGTKTLHSSVLKRETFGFGMVFGDIKKRAVRTYQEIFTDHTRQKCIEILLGKKKQSEVFLSIPFLDQIMINMEKQKSFFILSKTISIVCLTWNVAGSLPKNCLKNLIHINKKNPPTFFVFSLQEIMTLNAQSFFLRDKKILKKWKKLLKNEIENIYGKNFVLLIGKNLFGIALIIFVRKTHLPLVKEVGIGTKKTGMNGMTGNKGGIAIRIVCGNTSFCFVSSHLTAGALNVLERNNDFTRIEESILFENSISIKNNDVIIWMGDLNYRVDACWNDVETAIIQKDYEKMLLLDQLQKERSLKNVFNGYCEKKILFEPTYKIVPGEGTYNLKDKSRIPSWTDRILYFSNKKIIVKDYKSLELISSDHKPVTISFFINTLLINKKKKDLLEKKEYQKVLSEEKQFENFIQDMDKNLPAKQHVSD